MKKNEESAAAFHFFRQTRFSEPIDSNDPSRGSKDECLITLHLSLSASAYL